MRLEVEGLGTWRPRSGVAVEGLDLVVDDGEIVLLAGPNGAGASTVLAGIAGRAAAGERRVGTVRLGHADLTHPPADETARLVALVGAGGTVLSATVSELLGSSRRRAGAGPDADDLVDQLDLDGLGNRSVATLSPDLGVRVGLAAALVSRPHVLLLDHLVGKVEPASRARLCALVRAFADRGGLVLWADQGLAHVLTVADRVVELGDVRGASHPAWTWRPTTVPWTPLQQLATALGADQPGDQTVAGLQRSLPGPDAATAPAAPAPSPRGGMVPVLLGAGRELLVDDTVPPVVVADDARTAATCRDVLVAVNDVASPRIDPRASVRRVATVADRRWSRPRGSVLGSFISAVPAVRAGSPWGAHSDGEQRVLHNTLELEGPGTRVLHEPFVGLDGARIAELVDRVAARWRSGRATFVVTTDVEAVGWFDRVLIWSGDGLVADGRPSAVMDRLVVQPLLAQVLDPARAASA